MFNQSSEGGDTSGSVEGGTSVCALALADALDVFNSSTAMAAILLTLILSLTSFSVDLFTAASIKAVSTFRFLAIALDVAAVILILPSDSAFLSAASAFHSATFDSSNVVGISPIVVISLPTTAIALLRIGAGMPVSVSQIASPADARFWPKLSPEPSVTAYPLMYRVT